MTMLENSVIDSLVHILGNDNVLCEPYDLDRYSTDALTPFRAYGAESSFERIADVVVRPGSTQEVAQMVSQRSERTRNPTVAFLLSTCCKGINVDLG
jgi:FAD/FMN-containing dehydrogenase